jgi:parallel beta-helix repeat protein
MKRESVFLMFLLTILVVGSSRALEVQGVEASGTVYIRADGSIDPPTAPISTIDNVTYVFTGDINDSIVIERDNIVVDGALHIVEGAGSGIGITLSGRNNVTIKNMTIKAFGGTSISLSNSAGNSISGNNITDNGGCIFLQSSSTNSISGNNITNNDNNGIILLNSEGNTVSGNNITANKPGAISFDYSDNNAISGNTITNNVHGITLYSSSSNSFSENTIIANGYYGILLGSSSSNNNVSGNNITNNYGAGIELGNSAGNTISRNEIINDVRGIALDSSSNNVLSGNNVTNNDYGIELSISSSNLIFHNNFVDNTNHLSIMFSSVNIWDNGYPSGGNYWSDYDVIDQKNGPYQNLTGSDGIGDTPYLIGTNDADNYPLMNPWTRLPSDINGDGIVDPYDAIILANAFNSTPEDVNWNPNADMNGDGFVDIFDAILLASNFNKLVP